MRSFYWFIDFIIIIFNLNKGTITRIFYFLIFYYSLTTLDMIGLVISHTVNTVNYFYKTGWLGLETVHLWEVLLL